jgi:hypothetical protein
MITTCDTVRWHGIVCRVRFAQKVEHRRARELLLVRCPVCGAEFCRNIQGQRWCSPECSQQGMRRVEFVRCPICDLEFYRTTPHRR